MRVTGAVLGAMLGLAVLAGGAASAADRNGCGCYQTDSGSCYCDKKAKCGCPGECEPKGCEEKRQKEMEKEISAETKRAHDSERGRGGAAPAGVEKAAETKPASGKTLTAAQLRELSRLLSLYVAAHPDAGGKTVEQVGRDLDGAANK
jgi:hypothetical protein